jgi:hypothetical protein
MNRIKTFAFLTVATLVQTTSLMAQQQIFESQVPFQFFAGDRTLPAGDYRLARHNSFLEVENREGHSTALILAFGTDSSTDGHIHLVFDEVNNVYFLREIVAPGGNLELAISKTEKKAKMDQRRLSSAKPLSVSTPATTTGGQ